MKRQYARLIVAGKPSMVGVGAAMRKLLMLAFGVLKSRQKFDPIRKLENAEADALEVVFGPLPSRTQHTCG